MCCATIGASLPEISICNSDHEAIKETVLHIRSLDPRKLVDVHVNAAYGGLIVTPSPPENGQADLCRRMARSEHRRVEALYLTTLKLPACYAIVLVEHVSYRRARLGPEVKDDDRTAGMPCDERWRADDPPPLQPFLNDHLALK